MQEETAMSFRLSPQQDQLWSAGEEEPAGRCQATVLIEGPLDPDRLREALRRVAQRHEILRTTFERRPGMRTPLQVVREDLEPEWELTDAPESADRTRPWDYAEGPLIRAHLTALLPDRHTLVITVAAVCADAASLQTIVRELAQHYGRGQVAEEPLQYADFSEWQNQLLAADDEEAEAAKEFWSENSGGSSPPVPFLRRTATPHPEAALTVPLDAATAEAIESAAARYGTTSSVFALAAWHILLARLSGEQEVVVAARSGERHHAELETAVGAFARPLPLRSRLGDNPTFAEVAAQLAHAGESTARWQDYAPTAVAAELSVGFSSTESFEPVPAGDVTFALEAIGSSAQPPLSLEWTSGNGRAHAQLRFDPSAFDEAQAERAAHYLSRVLETAAGRPELPIDEFELLGADDLRRLTVELNETAGPVAARFVHDLFAEAAVSASDRPAVVDQHGSISYAELDTRSNQLAQRLRRAGVGPDVVVGLATDRSIEMVVGLLGILKAGGAYLPLNFEHPRARLGHQLSETGAPVLVTQEPVLDRLPAFDGEIVCLDRDRAALDAEPATAPEELGAPENLVYVMYTSGSTGTPKGVGVTHGNLVNYVQAVGSILGSDIEPLAFGMVTAISTDLGNTAVFPALCAGGTLVLVSPVAAADAAAMAAFTRSNPIDVLKITPSHLSALLVGADAAAVLPRRWLISGGEALSWDVVARVHELGECRLLNHYGPTETTVGSCTLLVEDGPGEYSPGTVPIGRPVANTACYVLDARGRPVPEGVAGELYIGGAGVARGYVGQPALTAERFRPDPFSTRAGPLMYATGDRARRLPDGAIEFLGRDDDQIKIRGFRVEPAEIEAALRAFDAVNEAVVIARDDGRGERRLVAYVVCDAAGGHEDLRRRLADHVPEFMIPAAFVELDSLPRTASGKIDRLALPSPEDGATGSQQAYLAPRTPLEENVAAIWVDVLDRERVGIDDDFFAIGGHSLLATQIVAQIRSDFSIELPLHALFGSPTVASLSQQIVEMMGQGADAETEELLAALEGLSDEEAERLLKGERPAGAEEG